MFHTINMANLTKQNQQFRKINLIQREILGREGWMR